MIDFSIPEETKLLIDTVRRFVTNELEPLEPEIEKSGVLPATTARGILDKSRALGLYAMNMPAEAGGAGLGAVEMCLVEEQFGRTSEILIRRAFGAVLGCLTNCKGEQRERYLLPAVRGDIIVAIAMTEPDAGSDAAGIKTIARADGEGFILRGSKHFISDADVANAFVITAVTDPAKGAKGITAFLVDRSTPGLRVGRIQEMMGLRGVNHCELFFDDVRVGKTQILGEKGEGLFQALSTISRARLGGVGARSVGLAAKILTLCLDQATQRKQFGRAIGDFQMIQAKLADMAVDILATRLLVLNAAWHVDQGYDPRAKVSAVKFQASEMLGRVTDHAVQIFGGMGFSKEMPLERYYRDARVYRIFDGTSEIHRLVVARDLLKRNGWILTESI